MVQSERKRQQIMATYREIASMVLDELRQQSDDSLFNENHVRFLADKYRAYIIRREYLFRKLFRLIPMKMYTPLCVDLELVNGFEGDECSNQYLRSTKPLPKTMEGVDPIVSSLDFFDGEFTYVQPERFKYTNINKWLKKIIYATIAPDGYLYLKSGNVQFTYLEKIKVSAVLDNPIEATDFSCDNNGGGSGPCGDPFDVEFPVEDSFIPEIIQSIVKELIGTIYRPKDYTNDANEDYHGAQNKA